MIITVDFDEEEINALSSCVGVADGEGFDVDDSRAVISKLRQAFEIAGKQENNTIDIVTMEKAIREMILDGKDDDAIRSAYAVTREYVAYIRNGIRQKFLDARGEVVAIELGEPVYVLFGDPPDNPVVVLNEICNHTHYTEVNGTHVHCTNYKGHDGDHGCEFGEYSLHWTRG